MITAQVHVSTGRFYQESRHVVTYSDLEKARSEFERVAALLKRRGDRDNDLPKLVELNGGAGSAISVPLDDICAVGFTDFALSNSHEAGVKDTYPHLFKK